jgi:hypothetical protein
LAYFSENNDRIDRDGKIVADIFCASMILLFAIASRP